MIVRGTNVYLRTVRETDLDWLYDKQANIETRGDYFPVWVTSEVRYKSDFREGGFWEADRGTALICDVYSDAILGFLAYFKATPYWDNLEIGYRLYDIGDSGRGIMSEALLLLSYVLFTTTKVHRLELKIVPDNIGSIRVAEKVGYHYEGLAREAWFHRGRHLDMGVYSLLRQELPTTLAGVLAQLPA